ncbi:MAG TPA: HNH endonuclease signature motif containing protein [Candidatus Binatia bacterium]
MEADAHVVNALERLPAVCKALETGAIRWTHARLLAGVALPTSEGEWLQLALTSTTRRLAELVKDTRSALAADAPPTAHESAEQGHVRESSADPDACASAEAVAAGETPVPAVCPSPGAAAGTAPSVSESADPLVHWTIEVTRNGRKLWRMVGDIASRVCGTDVPASRVAEAVAAEAMSWPVWEPPAVEALPPRAACERRESLIASFEAVHGTSEGFSWIEAPPTLRAIDRELESFRFNLDLVDAHEVDRRLCGVRSVMQRIDADLGAVLRKIADRAVHQRLGFADLRLYADSRLGVCGSKARALVRLDRQCALRSPMLLRAYCEGRVTWLAATAVLPVISPQHEPAWIMRAERVTLRRLEADVSWALDRADDIGGNSQQSPPPLDLDVTTDALSRVDETKVQMRARPEADLESFGRRVAARIGVVVPASVAALVEDAIEGCRRAVEPRWRGFERILAHAYLTWLALPGHENPVFARDSHRCQVPACRSRGPLHAHHVRFRSRGGPDDAWNLTAVCDEHHRAFIHRGCIHVHGSAPNALLWQLGCRAGERPLLRLRGDVYLAKGR